MKFSSFNASDANPLPIEDFSIYSQSGGRPMNCEYGIFAKH
jgi:hypothetical protein